MNYETNRHFYKKYIKETFQSKVEEFDWELFVGDEIALNVFDTQKYKMAIKRENFFFFIIDKDELLQILRMFSVTAPKLWDNKNNQKFHDAVKDKLTSIENARRLLEDFTKPINCNYDYKPRIS
jgi:esterase/lipase superfamily enzyme